jgi:hypothetical protein
MFLSALPRREESAGLLANGLAHVRTLPEEGQDDFCVLSGS